MITAKQLRSALNGVDDDIPVVVRVVSPAKVEMSPTTTDPDSILAVDDVQVVPIAGYDASIELTVFERQPATR